MLKSLLALIWILVAQAVDAPAPAGRITAIVGPLPTVHIESSAGKGARDGHKNDPVFASDLFVTAAGQVVTLELTDQSELVLAPQSRLSLIEYVQDSSKKTTVLGLLYGQLRTLVRRHYGGNGMFVVKTPTSVEGVRGTHFITDVDQTTGQTTLHTLSGTVAMAANLSALSDPATTTLVSSGYTAQMNKGATTSSTPQPFNSRQYHQQLRQSSPDFEHGVGSDAQGASAGQNSGSRSNSLSDALSRQHQSNGNSGSDPRGLRAGVGGGMGMGGSPGGMGNGGRGMGGGGSQPGSGSQPGPGGPGGSGGVPGGIGSGGSGPGGMMPSPSQSMQIPSPGATSPTMGTAPSTVTSPGGAPPGGGGGAPPPGGRPPR